MNAYFTLLFSLGIIAAVGGALLYDGEHSRVSRGAISVILLLAVTSPLVELISELSLSPPRLPEISEELSGEYAEVAEEAFCRGIAALLAEEYSVTLRGPALLCDPREVEKFINSYGIGVCYAEIGI